MRIGLSELIFIALIIVAIYSPARLPEYAKVFAKLMQNIKSAVASAKEVYQPLQEIAVPIKEVKSDIDNQLTEVKQSIKESGKEEM